MFKFNNIYRDAPAEGGGGGSAAPEGEAPTDNTPPTDGGAETPPSDNPTPPKEGEAPPAEDPKPADSEFKLPEEYKDKPWAAKVKSEEDLYKQIDNLTTLAGKKNAYPSDDATPEEWDKYFEGLRPESKDSYDFGENNQMPEQAEAFQDMLFEANISGKQAEKLIPKFQAWQKNLVDQETSEAGFEEIMTGKFGEKYDGVVKTVSKSLEAHTSEETQNLLNGMPNKYLGAMYEAMDSFLKAYGANEGGDSKHTGNGGTPPEGKSFEEKRDAITAKLNTLVQKPHTAQEKQALIDERQALYDARYGSKK